jgi:hypothetical protein
MADLPNGHLAALRSGQFALLLRVLIAGGQFRCQKQASVLAQASSREHARPEGLAAGLPWTVAGAIGRSIGNGKITFSGRHSPTARDGRLEPASGRWRRMKDESDGPVEGCSEAHDPSQQACLDPSQAGPDSAVGHEEPGFDDHQEADRQKVTSQVSQSYVAGDLSEGNHQAGASDGAPVCLRTSPSRAKHRSAHRPRRCRTVRRARPDVRPMLCTPPSLRPPSEAVPHETALRMARLSDVAAPASDLLTQRPGSDPRRGPVGSATGDLDLHRTTLEFERRDKPLCDFASCQQSSHLPSGKLPRTTHAGREGPCWLITRRASRNNIEADPRSLANHHLSPSIERRRSRTDRA